MCVNAFGSLVRLGVGLSVVIAMCGVLASCETSSFEGTLPKNEPQETLETPSPSIDETALYSENESISTIAYVPGRTEDQGNRDDVSCFFPHVAYSSKLPNGIKRNDFFIGALEEDSIEAMQDRLGFSFDENGDLPLGYSYALVTYEVENRVNEEAFYDSGNPSFATLDDEDGHYTLVGTADPLWRSDWDGANAKQYFFINLKPLEKKEISTLYALPDEVINSSNLVFIIDQGYGSGVNGFVGIKAFDIATQPKQ